MNTAKIGRKWGVFDDNINPLQNYIGRDYV